MDLNVGEIIKLKKPHPCATTNGRFCVQAWTLD